MSLMSEVTCTGCGARIDSTYWQQHVRWHAALDLDDGVTTHTYVVTPDHGHDPRQHQCDGDGCRIPAAHP